MLGFIGADGDGMTAKSDISSDIKVSDYNPEFVKKIVQGNLILYAMCFWIQQSSFPVSRSHDLFVT